MPSPQNHFGPRRRDMPGERQVRPGAAIQQRGLSRMALEQPDDTPQDQRTSRMPFGPRQMG